jgi:hypothetical protein
MTTCNTCTVLAFLVLFYGSLTSAFAQTLNQVGAPWDWQAPRDYKGSLKLRGKDGGQAEILYRIGKKNELGQFVVTTFRPPRIPHKVSDDELRNEWAARPLKATRELRFRDGTTLRVLDGRGSRSNGCYDDLDARVITTRNSATSGSQYRVLYVLPKPARYRTKRECLDGPDFTARVAMFSGDIVAFDATTFLLADATRGLVVRFDGQLHSESRLVGSRLFVVTENAYDRATKAFGDDELQRIHDALYELATSKNERTAR